MSALYVRDTFRTWCGGLPLPFVDTVNRSPAGRAEPWCTAVFDPFEHQRITFCDQYQEQGEIELVFMGKPGQGDHALAALAEASAALILQQTDPTGRLVLTGRGPLEDQSLGDADVTYRLAIRFPYVFTPA